MSDNHIVSGDAMALSLAARIAAYRARTVRGGLIMPHADDPTRDELIAELEAVQYAAHMPADYAYGLPSWINQHLYADHIDKEQAIQAAGRWEQRCLDMQAEIARLTRERDDAVAAMQAMAAQRDYYGDRVTEARPIIAALNNWIVTKDDAYYNRTGLSKEARAWLSRSDAWAVEGGEADGD